ncbi:MAG: AAA family ATPase [Alphaproteobacteria bacterium]|nr:AAA family ATPase [Alphaproteobacteria bacterium]
MQGVALGGFMGVGKSSVGRALAARLGLPFVDTDAVLAQRHGPVAEQIARSGEAAFRAREHALVEELARGPEAVVATGGGLWVDPRNRAALRRWGKLVVLQAPLEVLAARVGAGEGRPLWDDDVAARYAARQPAYADADLVVDTVGRTIDGIVEEIAAWRAGS